MLLKVDWVLGDIFKSELLIICLEGSFKIKQLIKYDSNTVNINFSIILFLHNHLRRNILNGATKGFPHLIGMYGAPKIRQFKIIILIKQKILQLNIPMNNMSLMKIIHRR